MYGYFACYVLLRLNAKPLHWVEFGRISWEMEAMQPFVLGDERLNHPPAMDRMVVPTQDWAAPIFRTT